MITLRNLSNVTLQARGLLGILGGMDQRQMMGLAGSFIINGVSEVKQCCGLRIKRKGSGCLPRELINQSKWQMRT